jgi:hypothetical protein
MIALLVALSGLYHEALTRREFADAEALRAACYGARASVDYVACVEALREPLAPVYREQGRRLLTQGRAEAALRGGDELGAAWASVEVYCGN